MSGDENIISRHQKEIISALIDEDVRIVISFDGGGIRGLISVIIAAAIEKAAGVPLALACDLLIGTSIGGLTALLFAAPDEENQETPKYRATDIAEHYQTFAKNIFSIPFSRIVKTLWGFDKSKYSNHKLKKIMEEYFNGLHVSQALTPTMVIGTEIERYIPLLFKSYESPDFFMKDAALATCAAPTFFPVAKIKSTDSPSNSLLSEDKNADYIVIDGMIAGSNNPALLGYIEICHLYRNIKDIKDKVIVISIGTGKPQRAIHYDEVAEAGFLAWAPFILQLIEELGSQMTDYQLELFLEDMPAPELGPLRRYWRLNPMIPDSFSMLDMFEEKKLKDIMNITKNYLLEHKRDIEIIGEILSYRAKYLNKKK